MIIRKVLEFLPQMHCLLIGPGLGRNNETLSNVGRIIEKAKELSIQIVIDAVC